eukprot:1149214-Pelagomonas_calceolata.AAC.6
MVPHGVWEGVSWLPLPARLHYLSPQPVTYQAFVFHCDIHLDKSHKHQAFYLQRKAGRGESKPADGWLTTCHLQGSKKAHLQTRILDYHRNSLQNGSATCSPACCARTECHPAGAQKFHLSGGTPAAKLSNSIHKAHGPFGPSQNACRMGMQQQPISGRACQWSVTGSMCQGCCLLSNTQ